MIERAEKAHNCQANKRHRIEKGQIRLKVRNGRSWDHYCQECAKTSITRDIETLTILQNLQTTKTETTNF